MNDGIQRKILNALLDKYERSVFFKDEKLPTRRIMLDFYNDGKSEFPFYDIEQSERRLAVNRATAALVEKNLLSFVWMKGEQEHIIARVWLNMEQLSFAYQLAEREPKGERMDKIRLEIADMQGQVKATWACQYLRAIAEEIAAKRRLASGVPADDEERRLLFQAISAIDQLEGAEYMERVFSLQTFGDTKKFERSVKSRLLSILRKYTDNDDDTADEDILRQIGIVKYPEQFEFCGNISVAFPSATVDFSCLESGGVIYSTDLAAGDIRIDPSVEVIMTIENRANYIEYVHKTKTRKELVIYHGGQYSPRKRKFLQAAAKAMPGHCRWYHWSDIDYGGFLMLSRLRREISPAVLPYRMSCRELQRYGDFAAAIKAPYAEKLSRLKTRPELSDCRECIDYMLEQRVRLEQEAMLAGG